MEAPHPKPVVAEKEHSISNFHVPTSAFWWSSLRFEALHDLRRITGAIGWVASNLSFAVPFSTGKVQSEPASLSRALSSVVPSSGLLNLVRGMG